MVCCILCLVAAAVIFVICKFWPKKIVHLSNLGNWAVVTGATDGIGKEFANQLAEKGFSVVLISRTVSKLNDVAKEIEEKYQVSTKVIQADFTSLDEQMYARINTELQSMDIGILVNNVGIMISYPQYFLDCDPTFWHDVLNCNVLSTVNMTRFVLPGMANRRRGLIINVSSMLSKVPAPLLGIYGATKSFVTKFSTDLDIEYRRKGVHVHVLNTGLVRTKLSGKKDTSFYAPSPQTYVKSSLEEVTYRSVANGYLSHTIIDWLYVIGNLISTKMVEFILFHHLSTRGKF